MNIIRKYRLILYFAFSIALMHSFVPHMHHFHDNNHSSQSISDAPQGKLINLVLLFFNSNPGDEHFEYYLQSDDTNHTAIDSSVGLELNCLVKFITCPQKCMPAKLGLFQIAALDTEISSPIVPLLL